jgi:hypothetical protein
MAVDKKITELVALAGASVISASDVMAIVDLANDETKKITIDALRTALGLDTMTMASGKGLDFSADSKGIFKGLEAIVWRLMTTVTNSDDPLGASGGEWELADDTENEFYLGDDTQVTESSGIFTIGSTGYWLIPYSLQPRLNGTDNNISTNLQSSTDNGDNFNTIGQARTSLSSTSNAHSQASSFVLLKVTSVTGATAA